jgi:hypothetical protein
MKSSLPVLLVRLGMVRTRGHKGTFESFDCLVGGFSHDLPAKATTEGAFAEFQLTGR